MTTMDAVRPLKQAGAIIPREFKAIMEEALILVLIMAAASSAHEIAKLLLGEHIPPVLEGLLTVSLWVMCGIYAIAVTTTIRKLVTGRLVAVRGTSARIWGAEKTTHAHDRRATDRRDVVAAATTTNPVSVLIVDDDQLVSSAIKHMLALDGRIGTIMTANSPDAAIAKIESGPEQEAPDVVLLDINYAGCERTGIDYLDDLSQASPQSKLVVMSVCREPATVKSALANDADGFIWKNESSVDFAEAVVGAAHHGFVASKSVAHDLFGAA